MESNYKSPYIIFIFIVSLSSVILNLILIGTFMNIIITFLFYSIIILSQPSSVFYFFIFITYLISS